MIYQSRSNPRDVRLDYSNLRRVQAFQDDRLPEKHALEKRGATSSSCLHYSHTPSRIEKEALVFVCWRRLRSMLHHGKVDSESLRTLDEALILNAASIRSEEHTSELQSPDHLVCRLLLEKKKNS